MNEREYRDVYLKSEHWQKMRAAALEHALHRCQVCNSPNDLDVHHRDYGRLGHEHPADLTVLCRHCHTVFHENPPPAGAGYRPLASAVDTDRLIAVLEAHPEGITIPGIRTAARPEWDAEPGAIKAELERLMEAGRVERAKFGIYKQRGRS